MKKIMITLLLAMFCWSAFGWQVPPQDTTKKRQDSSKKHSVKSKMPKMKHPWKDSTKKDSVKRKMMDTTRKIPPVF
ncbi:hypothetical protein HDC92_000205 [Pedobacter sp. AK017]|uniref:hypothetical protein n=1 Tax=Pedobacter sp. AK017 TaxID=2723073 RepID=UPI001613A9F5|nr:hypothetical protein [Pedobacter sp. AK017]MBB5436541.1 hypothetical protein [Pedobacter sp. AK017]